MLGRQGLLPAFSAAFGIHPWQVDDLTYREIEDYLARLRAMTKEA